MANQHFTAASLANIADRPRRLKIQNNGALTGTLTVKDGSTTIAVITNPAVGNLFEYGPFRGIASVTPSATCDITCWTE